MSEPKEENERHEPVRVVDRRGFTAEGDWRQPDRPVEEATMAPPPLPRPDPPAAGRRPAEPAADPVVSAQFQNLVVNLARQAAANLGASRHPLSGQIEVDLEGAQQMIDLLQALRQKTQGNLTSEESELIEGLIGDLQMQYVAVRLKAGGRP